ncbi:MAG: hypothetical protein AAF433_09910 [Bacteroidota bacterium]
MKRLFVLICLINSLFVGAQSYDLAAGLRLGTEWGASVQLRFPYVHKNFVVEGIIQQSMSKDEGNFTLLGRQHHPFLTRRLNIFMGGGLHFGWTNELDPETAEPYGNPWGIDGILGAELTIGRTNLSWDMRPAINFGGGNGGLKWQTGVSVRYVISKRNDIFDKQRERARNKERRQRQRQRNRERRRANGGGGIWPFNRNS